MKIFFFKIKTKTKIFAMISFVKRKRDLVIERDVGPSSPCRGLGGRRVAVPLDLVVAQPPFVFAHLHADGRFLKLIF
jgi:hypothetical protein